MARSSHPALSHCDSIANNSADVLMLIGRVLIGWLLLQSAWFHLTNTAGAIGYFAGLKIPSPEIMLWVILLVETVAGVGLVLGLATRYAAVLAAIFVIVATATAHRYWEYTGPALNVNYLFLTKNVGVLGGLLYIFVFGAGRYSVDAKWATKR